MYTKCHSDYPTSKYIIMFIINTYNKLCQYFYCQFIILIHYYVFMRLLSTILISYSSATMNTVSWKTSIAIINLFTFKFSLNLICRRYSSRSPVFCRTCELSILYIYVGMCACVLMFV